ncbi:mannonate dehydratase [Halomicrococcus sp. NG-SE-24]|uniref:mannonate dehydratase n=1 Tax=Halomicrococcus sp. NG-SE-24 TaxID=3436928 RepID=UPI003D958996
MKTAVALPAERDERWELAAQIGVEQAVVHPHMSEVDNGRRGDTPWEFDDLLRMKNAFEHVGLDVGVIEGGTPLTDVTRLGLDGRDEEIDRFCEFVRTMGRLDIPVLCYSWMTHFWWLRTSDQYPTRGGARTTAYDHDQMQRGPVPDIGEVTEEELWDTLEYFLERVVPVAEDAGVRLALHPDDPPLSPIRGVGRIITSVEAYDRVMDLYPSEANGINFCQGNFAAMGVDLPDAIRHFGDDIVFVHYRDIEGDAERLVETWHDDGKTDMVAAMEAYRDVGFDGPARPDHVPTTSVESNDTAGYEFRGRLFAIGYMRGLIDSMYRAR